MTPTRYPRRPPSAVVLATRVAATTVDVTTADRTADTADTADIAVRASARRAGGGVMLRRLVTWSYDRRRRVVVLWVAALLAAIVLAGVAGGDTEMDMTVPGSDSAEAVGLLRIASPSSPGARSTWCTPPTAGSPAPT